MLLLIVLFPLTIIATYFDVSRHYNYQVKSIVNNLFGNIMRKSELSGSFRLSGVTYMMSGFLLSATFFSKELAITSWFILIISDTIASLVGIKLGSIKVNEKTIEGSIAFFASAVFISIICYFYISYNTSFMTILISCLITTLIELYSEEININDNLLIPIGYCLVTYILNIAL